MPALFDDTFFYSYSGTDIVAEIVIPGESPLVLGELQTLSYSIHRENTPVRLLSHVNAAAFLKGPRTIAGSLIFTVFDEYTFYRLDQYKRAVKTSLFPLADMLPPFDISISYSNEYGRFSKMRIYGVTIVDEGGTMSIDDLITEQTYSYMARGIEPMRNYRPKYNNGESVVRQGIWLSSPTYGDLDNDGVLDEEFGGSDDVIDPPVR